MSSKVRPPCPFYANEILAFKLDRRLMESGVYLELSVETLRLYMMICYWMHCLRRDYHHFPYGDIEVNLGWSRQLVDLAAAELTSAGLLVCKQQQHCLEVSLPNRTVGRYKHPPAIDN